MADRDSAVSGVLRRPFREQVAFFRGKLGNLVPTQRWDDITAEAHDTAFMVAGAQKADLLADLAAAVDRAITEGKSLEAFRKDFAAAVERNDWHGWTGEDTKGGRAWRTRTIYRTNATVSYAAGRLAQLREGNFKFWVYRHGGSKEPRPEHLSWDGIALPPDHPFWDKHYPPSDWGCSCYVVGARTAAGVRRLGGDPDKTLPDGWDRVDPRTGEPAGIGKGWGYAPGASVAGAVQAVANKVGSWDYQIAKAYMSALDAPARDALSSAYRRLPSVATDMRRFAQRVLQPAPDDPDALRPADAEFKTVGMVSATDISRIADLTGRRVAGYDFSIDRSAVFHVEGRHGVASERTPGQRGVQPSDYERLPMILEAPDEIAAEGTSDMGEPLVRYQRMIGGERYVAILAIGGKKRRTLALKTLFIQQVKG
jgi:hypothetical protein